MTILEIIAFLRNKYAEIEGEKPTYEIWVESLLAVRYRSMLKIEEDEAIQAN